MSNEEQLSSFIKEQIQTGNKKLRNTWVFGAIAVLVAVGYMSVVLWVVRGFLEPATAARTIAAVVERNFPSMLGSVEKSLGDQAPTLASRISEKALQTLPVIRKQAENQIAAIHTNILPALAAQLSETMRANLAVHKPEIAQFVKAHNDEEIAKYFLDTLSGDMLKSLDRLLQGETPGRGLGIVQTAVVGGLGETKNYLSVLAKKNPAELSHAEQLQRKLIISLAILYQQTKENGGYIQGVHGH